MYPLSLVGITDYVHNVYVILNLALHLLNNVDMTYVHYLCLSLCTLVVTRGRNCTTLLDHIVRISFYVSTVLYVALYSLYCGR